MASDYRPGPAKEDTLLFISGEAVDSGSCTRKCIRISDAGVQFDDCYDEDSGVFEKDCGAGLNEKEIYSTLLHTSPAFWEALEQEIDAHHDVNAGLPFIVTIVSAGTKRSFVLLRTPLQDATYNAFMNRIGQVFDNWENCGESGR